MFGRLFKWLTTGYVSPDKYVDDLKFELMWDRVSYDKYKLKNQYRKIEDGHGRSVVFGDYPVSYVYACSIDPTKKIVFDANVENAIKESYNIPKNARVIYGYKGCLFKGDKGLGCLSHPSMESYILGKSVDYKYPPKK